jgi:hypothetical protein
MANLFKWKARKYNALMGKIAEKLEIEQGELLLANPKEIKGMIDAWLEYRQRNPFKKTLNEQLTALRDMNEFWRGNGHPCIDDIAATCERLERSAPEWPEGRDAHRIIKTRFGESREGMIQTFEAQCAAIEHVHGPNFLRWGLLLSGMHEYRGKKVDRLRLLNGNETHRPVVEWVIIPDLSQYRKRASVKAVRGPKSLADEGLALAWQVPERACAIDYKEWCAWFCAGYESNVPERAEELWPLVIIVHRSAGSDLVRLHAYWFSHGNSAFSVPSAQE